MPQQAIFMILAGCLFAFFENADAQDFNALPLIPDF